jgi:hypothetical protein
MHWIHAEFKMDSDAKVGAEDDDNIRYEADFNCAIMSGKIEPDCNTKEMGYLDQFKSIITIISLKFI